MLRDWRGRIWKEIQGGCKRGKNEGTKEIKKKGREGGLGKLEKRRRGGKGMGSNVLECGKFRQQG